MFRKAPLQTTGMGSNRKRKLPSPAVAIASIALVVALGATSYAAFKLPPNSVGTSQLRNRAVTSPKLRDGAVTSGKIQNGAVPNDKLTNAAVTSSKLHDGAVTSAKLAPGAITATSVPLGAGVSVTYRFGAVTVPAGQPFEAHVSCSAGTTVVGGGMTASDPSVVLNDSAPFNSKAAAWTGGPSDSWGVFVTNSDSIKSHVTGIYAICVTASAVH